MADSEPKKPNLRLAAADGKPARPARRNATAEASHFAAVLQRFGRILTAAYDSRMPLTRGQSQILSMLMEKDGLTQTEIATQMGIHKVSVGAHIDALVGLGLVERKPHPSDRRAKCIALTPQFQKVKGYGQNIFRMIHERALEGISREDYETALAVLERMEANLRNLAAEDVPVEKDQ